MHHVHTHPKQPTPPTQQPTLKLNPLLAAPSTQQQLPTKADKYKAADTPIVNELLPTSPRSTTTTTTTTAPTDTTDPPTTSVKKQRSIKPLKATPAGSRLIKNAPSKATATVRQLTDALNAGIRVHKHWQRDGRLRHGGRGSHRLVQAGVVDDKVLVEYPSGWWRTPKTSTVERYEGFVEVLHEGFVEDIYTRHVQQPFTNSIAKHTVLSSAWENGRRWSFCIPTTACCA